MFKNTIRAKCFRTNNSSVVVESSKHFTIYIYKNNNQQLMTLYIKISLSYIYSSIIGNTKDRFGGCICGCRVTIGVMVHPPHCGCCCIRRSRGWWIIQIDGIQ